MICREMCVGISIVVASASHYNCYLCVQCRGRTGLCPRHDRMSGIGWGRSNRSCHRTLIVRRPCGVLRALPFPVRGLAIRHGMRARAPVGLRSLLVATTTSFYDAKTHPTLDGQQVRGASQTELPRIILPQVAKFAHSLATLRWEATRHC